MKKVINKITFSTVLKAMPIIIIWALFFIVPQNEVFEYSVNPKNGIKSIFTGVLFHASYSHIINNTILLMILLPVLSRYEKGKKYYIFLLLAYLIPSIAIYIDGVPTIGISGLCYALFSYCTIKLCLEDDSKTYVLILLSFWGFSMISGLFPIEPHVSWIGHLSGFALGALWGIFGDRIEIKRIK